MIIYYFSLLFLITSGYYFCIKKTINLYKIIYLFLTGIIFTAFVSFRYAIGFDYYSYRTIFNTIRETSFSEINHIYTKELLFIYLNKLISYFGGTYHIFLFITGIFIHTCALYIIYRYSKLPWISVYFYFTFQFLAHNMNLIRQSLAVSFVLLSYTFLKEKKFFPYVIIILIGAGFHRSILCMIPFYFLLNYVKKLKSMLTIGVITLIIYLTMDQLINIIEKVVHSDYLQFYKDSYYWQGNSIKYLIFPAFYCLLTFYYRKLLLRKNSDNLILVNSAFYYFLIYLFITKHFILERFSIYLFIFSLILIPEIISVAKNKKIVTLLFLFLGIVYFLFAAKEGFHRVYPYISLLDKVK